jgi:hypothetical protein
MIDAKKAIDPPPVETPHEIVLRNENAALLATIAVMQADNARAVAAHGPPSPGYVPLKSIDPAPYTYEALRIWAEHHLIEAEKRAGRWFALPASAYARIKLVMTPKS